MHVSAKQNQTNKTWDCENPPSCRNGTELTRYLSVFQGCIFSNKNAGACLLAQTVRNLPACKAGDLGLIPGLGRSPGERNGHPLQHSCLGNPMDRGAWRSTCSPWGREGSNTTEQLTLSVSFFHRERASEGLKEFKLIHINLSDLPEILNIKNKVKLE